MGRSESSTPRLGLSVTVGHQWAPSVLCLPSSFFGGRETKAQELNWADCVGVMIKVGRGSHQSHIRGLSSMYRRSSLSKKKKYSVQESEVFARHMAGAATLR
jgi:hypothetical protein